MNRLYFIGLVGAAGAALYFCGWGAGNASCRERIAAHSASVALAAQTDFIEKQRKIDVQVVNTAVADIRRVLREKYTIAQ